MPVSMNINVFLEDAASIMVAGGWEPIRIIAYGHSHQRFKDNQDQGHAD